uniref:Ig-like domain-containing protein n=1 Tax=Oncorhynchus mykiss TaxID=8022 RepID=A0A8C7SGZ2_ONCMY
TDCHLFTYVTLLFEVTQTPTILWGPKDSDAQINCSHTKGATYNQMYWYRQLPGEGMKQVVYTSSYSDPEYGDFREDKYPTVKAVAESGSFTVKKLEAGDSGMYFCAVSQHSDTDNKYSCTQTPVFQQDVT